MANAPVSPVHGKVEDRADGTDLDRNYSRTIRNGAVHGRRFVAGDGIDPAAGGPARGSAQSVAGPASPASHPARSRESARRATDERHRAWSPPNRRPRADSDHTIVAGG